MIARRQCWNAMIKVRYIKSAWLGPSWLVPRLLGRGSGVPPAILAPDLADWPKIDLAVACATLVLGLPNLWNLVGVIQGAAHACPGSPHLLWIPSTLIKEFDWGFFHFYVVLTMKFLSFCDSFFIVKKSAKMQFFQLSETHTHPLVQPSAPMDSWRFALSIEQAKRVMTVGNFGVNRPALSANQF